MNQKRILIIGAGFLGRALAGALNQFGHYVTVLSPNVESSQNSGKPTFLRGRQEDQKTVETLLCDHATVIHSAWGTTPASSTSHPSVELETGLAPCCGFLESLRLYPSVRLLFLSSGGTVYGNPERLPVTENAPLRPLSCHGAGKVAAEVFLSTLGFGHPARSVVLRPSNIYGPGQPYRRGFGVLRHLLQCAVERKPFALCGDGSQVRDYLYVNDFVDAVVRLIEHDNLSGTYNLGSGFGTSLNELIALVEHTTGHAIRIEPHPLREGDVGQIVLDTNKIRQATGWAPSTALSDGVRQTWHWIRENV